MPALPQHEGLHSHDTGVAFVSSPRRARHRPDPRSLPPSAPHRYIAPMTIRVVVAEDNALLRDGLARLLSSSAGFELVGTAVDYDTLLAVVDESRPDVVITDIRMPPTGTDEGIRAAAVFSESNPEIGVIVLSQYVSPAYAVTLLAGGSARRGYLLKDRVAAVDDLLEAVRVVAAGGAVIDPQVVEHLVASSRRSTKTPLEFLTPREREVLGAMAQGKSNAAIAAALVLSERAVEKHINAIFSKLHLNEEPDVNRRVSAVLMFLSSGDAGNTSTEVTARFSPPR